MKIIITEAQLTQLINEDIDPNEALDDLSGLLTVVDGKRNICTVNFLHNGRVNGRVNDTKIKSLINDNNLKTLSVPSNPYNLYLVYREGSEGQAEELKNLIDKYDGFLSYKANDEDTYLFGKLLQYNENEILKYIKNRERE